MIAKELIDARWKAMVGGALASLFILVSAFTYDLVKNLLNTSQLAEVSKIAGPGALAGLANYDIYIWGETFNPARNAGLLLMIVAALLGVSMIAGEVSKGTIFLLLSRPLSRERILLTKYLVGAALLLCMNVLMGVLIEVSTLIAGRPQQVGGIALSVLLFWLGTLFVLGISTLFSVVFSDLLRPLALTVGVLLLLSLPGFLPGGQDWTLPTYWTNLPAFLGQSFPARELLVSLVAAALPLLMAVPLFRRQAY